MHRQRFHPGFCRPDTTGVAIQSWEEYDPRAEAFFSEDNRYVTGPGAFLPAKQQPHSTRSEGLPYKICIRGIHHHTTTEGIRHILLNYGNPFSVDKIRNRYNEAVAFVDFETQREAENAIIALDGKPPLNWRVSFAYTQRQGDRFDHELDDEVITSEIERQQSRFDEPGITSRARPPINAVPLPVAPTTVLPAPASSQSKDFPACVVCGNSTFSSCTVCSTRYCSVVCQRSDWPKHQKVCIPPPPLKVAGPLESVRPTAMKMVAKENGVNLPFVHQPATLAAPVSPPTVQVKSEAPRKSSGLAHQFVIKGIHPLDKTHTNSNGASVTAAKVENKSLSKEGMVSATSSRQNSQYLSPKTSTNQSPRWASPTFQHLPSKPGSVTPPNFSPPIHGTTFQQPRLHYLCSQTLTPSSHSPMSSMNPSPLSEIKKYAMSYPKPNSPFPGNDIRPVVCICFVKSPEEFFVHPVSHRKELQLVSEDIQRSVLSCDGVTEPCLGAPCVAIFKDDGNWYRAQILKVFPGNPVELGVRFVDYGNTAKMPNTINNFRMLEHKFAKYPGFAVKVKLADVLPTNGHTWESHVNTAFEQLVQEKKFILETLRIEEDHLVVRMKTRNGHDLGAELVRRSLAKTLTQQTVSNDLDPKSTPPLVSSPAPSPLQVAQKPPLPAAVPVSAKATTAEPVSAKATTAPYPAQNKASVSKPVPSTMNNSPNPRSNDAGMPALQATKPVSQIEAVPTQKQNGVKTNPLPTAVKSNSIISKLKEGTSAIFMVTELNDNYVIGSLAVEDCYPVLTFHDFVHELPPQENFRPPVNAIVSAFSEKFSSWYRGYVLQNNESTSDIFYVDYGNLDYGVQKLKPLPSDFDYPELAVKLNLPKQLQPDTENFLKEKLFPESTLNVVISATRDECICNVLDEDDRIKFAARLEPWTALVAKKIASPSWESSYENDVLVVSAEDINKIFVTSVDAADTLGQVQQELLKCAESFEATPPFKCPPKPGSYVVAFFPEDGELYRAKILSTEDVAVTVEYIDYGNSCSIPLDLMRPLPENLYELPACGRFVSLSCVERLAGPLPEPVKSVLADCVDHLCRIFVVAVKGDCVEVTLTRDERLVNQQITDILQSLNKSAPMPALAPGESEESQKPYADNTLGYFAYDDCNFLNLPEKGTCQAIILSNDEPRSMMLCLADEEILKKLTDLQGKIQEYASTVNRSHTPQSGEICLARSTSDGLWYRAACLEVDEGPGGPEFRKFLCVQVDYGEIIISDFDGLRRIPKRFVEDLPFVAVQAVLKEFVNFEKETDDNLNQILQELIPRRSKVELSVVGREGDAYVVDIPGVGEKLARGGFL